MEKKIATVLVVIAYIVCLSLCIGGILGCFDAKKINHIMPIMFGGTIIGNGFIMNEKNRKLKQLSVACGCICILVGMITVIFG